MESIMCPVDVIALCRSDGKITPLRIRGERKQENFRGEVLEIVKTRRLGHLGSESLLFVCWVNVAGERELLELKYHFSSGAWNLICPLC